MTKHTYTADIRHSYCHEPHGVGVHCVKLENVWTLRNLITCLKMNTGCRSNAHYHTFICGIIFHFIKIFPLNGKSVYSGLSGWALRVILRRLTHPQKIVKRIETSPLSFFSFWFCVVNRCVYFVSGQLTKETIWLATFESHLSSICFCFFAVTWPGSDKCQLKLMGCLVFIYLKLCDVFCSAVWSYIRIMNCTLL